MNENPFFCYSMFMLYLCRMERSLLNTCACLLIEQMNNIFKLLR